MHGMSDSEQQPPENESEPPGTESSISPSDKKALRRKTLAFIIIFIVSAFVLLVGYDQAKNTRLNDWYLLRVAQSTAWLLNKVGESCTVADPKVYTGREAEIRAALEAWKRGEDAPPPPEKPSDNSTAPPLTPWEVWQFEAGTQRESIVKIEREIEQLREDNTMSPQQQAQVIALKEKTLLGFKMRDNGPRVAFVLKNEIKDDGAKNQQKKKYSFSFILIPTCSAVQEMVIFLSAILAFPARWWKKIIGLLIGLPALYWVNAFRLMVLACIGALDPSRKWFNFAHEYLWQGIYIVFVVALWMGWVELLVRRKN